MSGALGSLPTARASMPSPRVSRDDQWRAATVIKGRSLTAASVLVLFASLAVHGAFVATAFFSNPAPPPRPAQETPVEIVSEVPKAPEPMKRTDAKPTQVAKSDEPKPPEARPPQAEPTEAKPPETKTEPPPNAQEKPIADLRPRAAPPPAPTPDQSRPPAAAKEAAELKALRDELASLKAETAQLQGDVAAHPAPTAAAARLPDGLGPLPESFQAVALPSDTRGEGELVAYPELVFSQLAKAKGFDRREGQPGTAGVRFDVDAAGGLLDVEIVASSGIRALDDEAVALVRKAAPFPAPPEGAQRSFSANVSFVTQASR